MIHQRSNIADQESNDKESHSGFSSLPYMPIELWLFIAGFYFKQYLPKLEVVTTQAGLDELGLQYGDEHIQKDAASSYIDDMEELKGNLGCSIIK